MDYDEIHEDLWQDSRTFINEALAGWDQNGTLSDQAHEDILDILIEYGQVKPLVSQAADDRESAIQTLKAIEQVYEKYADRYISERMSNEHRG